ncbi:MAG: TM2 domain-containing protein [Spirochaetales bacterium]|nr:TM2 domain-containing protein [Spirochaetales bacterium]
MYSTLIAYLLWIVSGCGALGFHRFYLNKIGSGILYMFTGGLFGLGALYDLVTLPTQVREANLRIKYQGALHLIEQNIDPSRVVPPGYAHRGKPTKQAMEQIILGVARKNEGVVTPSELALEAGMSIDQSKKALDTLTSKGFADMRVTKTGTIIYYFADFAPRGSHDEFDDML